MSDWNKVNEGDRAPIWRYVNDGDEVSGVYVESHETPNKMQPGQMTNVYTLRKADGSEIAVFGKSSIDRSMAKIARGDEVRIVYKGKQRNPKSGFSFHAFDVFNRKPQGNTAPKTQPVEEEISENDMPF